MSIKEIMQRYRGQRDERIVAETNRIYKGGFLALSLGFIVYIYYVAMKSQVALFNEIDSISTIGFEEVFLYLCFMITNIACVIAMIRKGFVDDGRFAETELFPAGYFAVWSGLAALGAGLLATCMRALAEWELLGFGGIGWPVNNIIGVFLAFWVFVFTYLTYYMAFRAAKRRREKMMLDLEE